MKFDKALKEKQNHSKAFIQVEGEIMEIMPSALFKIKLDNDHEILGHLSGKMRMNRIHIIPGDRVRVEMSPYDLMKGRITFRL